MSPVIYEVRDYHYRPDLIGAYRVWADEAAQILKAHLDVVGFWVDEGRYEPLVKGSDPFDSPIGHANVTWIIRWESREAREVGYPKAFAGPDWASVKTKHPDTDGYRQMTVRFMDAL